MDIRSIVTSVDGGEESRLTLEAAIALGQRFRAHVDVLHVSSFSEMMLSTLQARQGVVEMAKPNENNVDEVEERALAARKMFDSYCVAENLTVLSEDHRGDDVAKGATFCWRRVVGHEGPELAKLGRISDLIVVPITAAWKSSAYSVIFETALFDTGRLVYAANPLACEVTGRKIAIAWDGSREAAASVGQALPFLSRADKVWVHTVREDNTAADPDSLASYLARHEVNCEFRAIERRNRSVGNALLRAAEEREVDLLVMGAYGQGIAEEGGYGGVTRTILQASKMPILLAH